MTLTRRGRAVLYPLAVLVAVATGLNAPVGVPIAVAFLVWGFVLIGRAFRLEAQPRRQRAGGAR